MPATAESRSGLRAALLAVFASGLLAAGPARAMGFAEAFAAARGNDAQFRAAGHALESTRMGVPIARASLLPNVVFNMSRADVSGTRQFYNGLNQEVQVQVAYGSPQTSLSVRMPLLNQEARVRYDQAQVETEAAEQEYRKGGLDLLDRVGTAYLQVLLAEDGIRLAEQQVVALQAQFTRAEQRFKRGEGTRTEAAMAQASLDLARVKVVEATDQLETARRNLRRLTGRETPRLNQLAAEFEPQDVMPNRLTDWLDLAGRNSPSLQARQQQLMVARLGVKRQSAGHLPRVDVYASIARNENESLNNLGQTSVLKTMGVQVNLPIYSGGGIDASVKKAMAEQLRAEEDIKAEREIVELEVQRNYQAVANGATKLQAYRRAVQSSEVAYRGAVRTQEVGLATTADVLDSQARLYSAQRDLSQARYDYLLARLRLQTAAGTAVDEVVTDIDRQLPLAAAAKP